MALPPSIPTSFVPKQPVTTTRRQRVSSSVPALIGYFIAGVALVAAGLVFGYQFYLGTVRDAKAEKLRVAEAGINAATVEDFIRLRNRFRAAETLLDTHVRGTQFFDVLEQLTLQNIRFQSLELHIAADRSADITMHGIAKSFNALAAESAAFAGEKRIKRAIFSDIAVDKAGTVTFTLNADLEPSLLIAAMPDALPVPEPEAPAEPAIAPEPVTVPESAASTTPAAAGTTTPSL